MAHIIVTARSGETRSVTALSGTSVMELIREGGIDDLAALCGGSCSCATCHIYVDAERFELLPPASETEEAMLMAASHRGDTSRLGCQLIFDDAWDGMQVKVAQED